MTKREAYGRTGTLRALADASSWAWLSVESWGQGGRPVRAPESRSEYSWRVPQFSVANLWKIHRKVAKSYSQSNLKGDHSRSLVRFGPKYFSSRMGDFCHEHDTSPPGPLALSFSVTHFTPQDVKGASGGNLGQGWDSLPTRPLPSPFLELPQEPTESSRAQLCLSLPRR